MRSPREANNEPELTPERAAGDEQAESTTDSELAAEAGLSSSSDEEETNGGNAEAPTNESDAKNLNEETSSGGGNSDVAANDSPQDLILHELEEELRKPVPRLLESLVENQAKNNEYQKELDNAHARYRHLLEQTRQLYVEMRATHGWALDKAQPYLEALREADAAAERAEDALNVFSASARKHAEGTVTLRQLEDEFVSLSEGDCPQPSRALRNSLVGAVSGLAALSEERDEAERRYRTELEAHSAAQRAVEAVRTQVGASAALQAEPCFRQIEGVRNEVEKEQLAVTVLEEKVLGAKAAHRQAMSQLERINIDIHAARSRHRSTELARASSSDREAQAD